MILCYLADAASVHTQRWASHFAAQGYTVHLLSFHEAIIPGVTVHVLGSRSPRRSQGGNWQLLLSLPAIKRLLAELQPDLLHSHYLTSYGLLGALSGFRPHVASAWGSDVLVTPQRSMIYRWLLRYTFAHCDTVTSDSTFMADEALKYGLDSERLHVVPFGVDLTRFNQQGRLFPKKPPFSLLHMRFLDANANTAALIQALPAVLEQMRDIQLIITHEGPELKFLTRLVSSLNLGERIKFKGRLPHTEVPSLLQQADLYFSLLRYDATSVNLLEAMACGAFPIVSDIPANREWISDGENGYLIPVGDLKILSQKIVQALNQPELRHQAATQNWQRISREADWQKNMQIVDELYCRLLA